MLPADTFHDRPVTYSEAVDRYLLGAGVAKSSQRVYRTSLANWSWLLAGEQTPTGVDRRRADPPDVLFAALDNPQLGWQLARGACGRAERVDGDTFNRELSILRTAIAWWKEQGWLRCDPTSGIRRVPAPADRTRALSHAQIDALWDINVPLREKTLWRLLYETAGRAEEILTLDVPDLDMLSKRARIVAKGGDIEWVHWQSGAAQLLPRLLRGRRAGPVFLTSRRAPAGAPTLDTCPVTGRARLSYHQAEDLFVEATRQLSPHGGGWTLHQLRHSALTHDSETETNTPMLLARSRHASVRSLERYAHPSVDAVARHVATRDPAARRRTPTRH